MPGTWHVHEVGTRYSGGVTSFPDGDERAQSGYGPLPRAGVGTVVGMALAVVVAFVLSATGGPGGQPAPDRSPAPDSVGATEEEPQVRSPERSSRQPVPATQNATSSLHGAGAAIPGAGSGSFRDASVSRKANRDEGEQWTIAVRVEEDLPFEPDTTAEDVIEILQDDQGWQDVDGVRFALVEDTGAADVVVSLATPDTTDERCAPLDTGGEVSCSQGPEVILNAERWAHGVEHIDDLGLYRQYLVNHEVGHSLGHGHVGCPAAGEPAPLMMQQTKSLDGCTPNPWPAVA